MLGRVRTLRGNDNEGGQLVARRADCHGRSVSANHPVGGSRGQVREVIRGEGDSDRGEVAMDGSAPASPCPCSWKSAGRKHGLMGTYFPVTSVFRKSFGT